MVRYYEEDGYGINKQNAHPRALELIKEEFFWDCSDELAPFGSDEGDTALSEFRDWKDENQNEPVFECIKWTIEGVGEIHLKDYNERLLDRDLIEKQIADVNFDVEQYIFTLDVSIIATGFGQLVDEGKIDKEIKPFIRIAIERQKLWAKISEQENVWYEKSADNYVERMNMLLKVLNIA